jgi:hypothetical protein
MEANAYLFELLAALAYCGVAVRLLRLAARTRQRPERMLGVYFAASGISYLLYETPLVLAREDWQTPAFFAGRVLYDVALLPFLLFLIDLFHRGQRWAVWLAATDLALLFAGLSASIWTGDYEGLSVGHIGFWCEWMGYTFPFAWLAAVALAGHRQARRRVRIGLVAPLVANRYLLWGLFAVLQVAISGVLIAMYAEYAADGAFSFWADTAVGTLEMGSIGTLYLVFFSPRAYRRWLAARTEAVAVGAR